MSRLLLCFAGLLCAVTAVGQNIKGHYVARMQEDGTVYHAFPCTLFASAEFGDLAYDVTYKERKEGRAVINFTYETDRVLPADSIRFVSGNVVMSGPAEKIYIDPRKQMWKHRYSVLVDIKSLGAFYEVEATPEVTIYANGKPYLYRVKRSAWRSYAPIGYKILEVIRYNEQH